MCAAAVVTSSVQDDHALPPAGFTHVCMSVQLSVGYDAKLIEHITAPLLVYVLQLLMRWCWMAFQECQCALEARACLVKQVLVQTGHSQQTQCLYVNAETVST
jgi:hypothetical protein